MKHHGLTVASLSLAIAALAVVNGGLGPRFDLTLVRGAETQTEKTRTPSPAVPMHAAIVKGTATFADGRPAAGALVYIGAQGHESRSLQVQRTCDDGGAFQIPLRADCYCLFTAVSKDQVSRSQSRLVRLGQPVEPVRLLLQPVGRVHGRLTIGKDIQPVPHHQLSLYERPELEYWELPKEQQQMPNPKGSRLAIVPRIVRWTNTDTMGRFEFFAAPGRYYLVGPANVKTVEFEMRMQPSYIINLYQDRPERGPFACRVILQTDLNRGVPEAKLLGYGTGDQFAVLKGVADAEGKFQGQRNLTSMMIQAKSKDGSLSGIVKIGPDDDKAVIPIGPTASVHGRLIERSSGKPVANRPIDFSVRITHPDGTMTNQFGGSDRTDAHGEFTLTGLTVGWKFDLIVPQEGGISLVCNDVLPEKPGLMEIGEVSVNLAALRVSGTVAAKKSQPKREPIYNPKADAKADIEAALKTAKAENKRVLIEFGANWCGWCYRLYDAFKKDTEVSALLNKGFVLVLVDIDTNEKLFNGYVKEKGPHGFPFLTVLDVDGKVLRNQRTDELEDGPKHDVVKVKAFLNRWSSFK